MSKELGKSIKPDDDCWFDTLPEVPESEELRLDKLIDNSMLRLKREVDMSLAKKSYGNRKKSAVRIGQKDERLKDVTLPTTLLPLEKTIMDYSNNKFDKEEPGFYGYALIKILSPDNKKATKGSFYKALWRLENWGMLNSRQEHKEFGRTGRIMSIRIYNITQFGLDYTLLQKNR